MMHAVHDHVPGPAAADRLGQLFQLSRAVALSSLILVNACGDLPQPYRGNAGGLAPQLVAPPGARVAVPRPRALLPDEALADRVAQSLAEALRVAEVPAVAAEPLVLDWRVAITPQRRGDAMVLRYALIDPDGAEQGSAESAPVPLGVWASGAEAPLRDVSRLAARRIGDMMLRAEAERKASQPAALVAGGPPRIRVVPVGGAPGDGNLALTMRLTGFLTQAGFVVSDSASAASFAVQGVVTVSNAQAGMQNVEIVWIVSRRDGEELGRVAQLNEIPRGTLDRNWGDVAYAAAEQAAGGVRTVVNNAGGFPRPEGGSPQTAASPRLLIIPPVNARLPVPEGTQVAALAPPPPALPAAPAAPAAPAFAGVAQPVIEAPLRPEPDGPRLDLASLPPPPPRPEPRGPARPELVPAGGGFALLAPPAPSFDDPLPGLAASGGTATASRVLPAPRPALAGAAPRPGEPPTARRAEERVVVAARPPEPPRLPPVPTLRAAEAPFRMVEAPPLQTAEALAPTPQAQRRAGRNVPPPARAPALPPIAQPLLPPPAPSFDDPFPVASVAQVAAAPPPPAAPAETGRRRSRAEESARAAAEAAAINARLAALNTAPRAPAPPASTTPPAPAFAAPAPPPPAFAAPTPAPAPAFAAPLPAPAPAFAAPTPAPAPAFAAPLPAPAPAPALMAAAPPPSFTAPAAPPPSGLAPDRARIAPDAPIGLAEAEPRSRRGRAPLPSRPAPVAEPVTLVPPPPSFDDPFPAALSASPGAPPPARPPLPPMRSAPVATPAAPAAIAALPASPIEASPGAPPSPPPARLPLALAPPPAGPTSAADGPDATPVPVTETPRRRRGQSRPAVEEATLALGQGSGGAPRAQALWSAEPSVIIDGPAPRRAVPAGRASAAPPLLAWTPTPAAPSPGSAPGRTIVPPAPGFDTADINAPPPPAEPSRDSRRGARRAPAEGESAPSRRNPVAPAEPLGIPAAARLVPDGVSRGERNAAADAPPASPRRREPRNAEAGRARPPEPATTLAATPAAPQPLPPPAARLAPAPEPVALVVPAPRTETAPRTEPAPRTETAPRTEPAPCPEPPPAAPAAAPSAAPPPAAPAAPIAPVAAPAPLVVVPAAPAFPALEPTPAPRRGGGGGGGLRAPRPPATPAVPASGGSSMAPSPTAPRSAAAPIQLDLFSV